MKYAAKCRELRKYKCNKDATALKFLKGKISPSFYRLLECQLRNHRRHPCGRRYEESEKLLFLSLRQKGAKAFRGLPFVKPVKATLRKKAKALDGRPRHQPPRSERDTREGPNHDAA